MGSCFADTMQRMETWLASGLRDQPKSLISDPATDMFLHGIREDE